jgi:hypothetical protein
MGGSRRVCGGPYACLGFGPVKSMLITDSKHDTSLRDERASAPRPDPRVPGSAVPWRATGRETPVFLDTRGRRAALVRLLGVSGGLISAAAVALLVIGALAFGHISQLRASQPVKSELVGSGAGKPTKLRRTETERRNADRGRSSELVRGKPRTPRIPHA